MRIFATSRPTAIADSQNLNEGMEEEIAKGRQFYMDGLILQAYMHPAYARTFMILEADSIETARARFSEYPQVKAGLVEFEFTPLVGMPAIAQVHTLRGQALPPWWPTGDVK